MVYRYRFRRKVLVNMLLNNSLLIYVILSTFCIVCHGEGRAKYENWKFHFLPGSGMGTFLAVALPLQGRYKNVYLAYNFEANYQLPGNQTSFEYPPIIQRRIDRKLIYDAIEVKMNNIGYPGKACLLRTICEVASSSILHLNGVLGDILHVIFTPTSSKNNSPLSEYVAAEKQGYKMRNCQQYITNCTTSFLDLITWIKKAE